MAKEAPKPFMESPTIKAFIVGKNIELRIKGKRISFAHLFTPQERRNDRKELTGYNFSLNVLIPKENEEDVKLIQACQKKVMELQWGDNPPKIPPERRALRDGEPKDEDTEERVPLYDGYAGMVYLSANRGVKINEWQDEKKNPVQILDSRRGPDGKFPRLKEGSGKCYSGSVNDVIVRLYGYDGTKDGNPNRVNASLEGVKFVRHAQAFGNSQIDADAAFDEEDDEEMDGGTDGGSDFSDDDDLLG